MRRPKRYQDVVAVLQHIHNLNHQQLLTTALTAIHSVDTRNLQTTTLKGSDFANALSELQLAAISSALNQR